MKIVFMGTPEFAVHSLDAIYNSEHTITGVITAPDRPAGRGKKIKASAIKEFALSKELKLLQPLNLKDENFLSELKSLNADLFIVVAFRMIPEKVWMMPPKGTINLHASLLPNYRGASPINWAVINGDKTTGLSTFYIEKEIDTGKILMQQKVNINIDDNAGILHDKLMREGSALLLKTINGVEKGSLVPIPQKEFDNGNLRSAPKIYKDTCRINWEQPNINIYNFIRGLSPYPGSWTKVMIDKKVLQLKIYKAELSDQKISTGKIHINNRGFYIGCKQGCIKLAEVQLEGKKRMDATQFILGNRIINNTSCL